AHGLSFSVKKGIQKPPSLENIYKELNTDLGCTIPQSGDLTYWAEQGVLLLNSLLTVRAHQAFSHKGMGWEQFTDAAIKAVAAQDRPIVYILWGSAARSKKVFITNPKHLVIESAHPSPLSAYRGFFGSRPFSKCNDYLSANGITPIDWQIRD
ncbi:MAG: uracil-DNA glycosylase, partial [Lachnospiraceae bacterium]|nr:uracil-DNA glycosylase [Lachnospiraceae bacterium]